MGEKLQPTIKQPTILRYVLHHATIIKEQQGVGSEQRHIEAEHKDAGWVLVEARRYTTRLLVNEDDGEVRSTEKYHNVLGPHSFYPITKQIMPLKPESNRKTLLKLKVTLQTIQVPYFFWYTYGGSYNN